MIIELFYTAKFRQLIDALDQKDKLNKRALYLINDEIISMLKPMIIILSFSIVIAFISEHKILGLCISVFLLFAFAFDLYRKAKYYINISCLVSFSSAKFGILQKIYSNTADLYVVVGWHLKYSYNIDNKEYKNRFWLSKKTLPVQPHYTKGQQIEILYDPENPKNSIPNIPEWKEFNLRKT